MATSADSISISILVLLTFLSAALVVYSVLYLYGRFKANLDKDIFTDKGKWLANDREPLIPGNFHAETIQPTRNVNDHDVTTDDSMDETDYKERNIDNNHLGRIIFVMRYQKRREELMIRLVQIEGIPVSKELYNANSAYVDVQLKYTGRGNLDMTEESEVGKPRLDICLQEVYYFIISPHQMMTHTVEFQVNTFDDQFRRYVSGVVQVNLMDELADDLWTGTEVVFVKDIEEPFKITKEQYIEDSQNTHQELTNQVDIKRIVSRQTSNASSNMSWEPESRDLLTLSANSLLNIRPYEEDLNSTLSDSKRAHSVGYLPTYEWTVKDIPLDEDDSTVPVSYDSTQLRGASKRKNIPDLSSLARMTPPLETPLSPPDNFTLLSETLQPTPESFYHIVPMTPLLPSGNKEKHGSESYRKIMYKKQPKHRKMTRSVTVSKRSTPKHEPKHFDEPSLERSASWPDLTSPITLSSSEITPEHRGDMFFN